MTTAFVVLHYKTKDITIDCLDHLLKIAPDSPIVVVDNGSADGSGEELRARYGAAGNVVVIINNENLGFARGNNTGYKYVKDHFDADCVVVMNNDVIITQEDFGERIAAFMKDNSIDVCGPDVITPEGRHQNPLMRQNFSTFRIVKLLAIEAMRLLMLKLHIMQKRILDVYAASSNSYQLKEVELDGVTDCVLHGSCVAYSCNYLSNEENAFVPVTFLYAEEMILYDYCKRHNYRTGICPGAQVTHLGGKTVMKGALPVDKQIFKTTQLVKSFYQVVKQRLVGC